MLKSDYFRIEINQTCYERLMNSMLKSDYFRIEINSASLTSRLVIPAKIRLF